LGLSLAKGVVLVLAYPLASLVVGMALGFATVHALYPGVAGWRGPAVSSAVGVGLIAIGWFTLPANRPHIGALLLRIAMVALLPIWAFAAKRLISAGTPVARES
jgi:hypothetical protein